jgi:hypothetical protein
MNPLSPATIAPMTLQRAIGGGDDPNKKISFKDDKEKTAYWMGMRKKYGDQWLQGRMQWMDWAGKKLPAGVTPTELSQKWAKAHGLDAGDLLASSFEEGMPLRFPGKDGSTDDISQAYDENLKPEDQKAYPVDGFRAYGLDTVGSRYKDMIKRGYLPQDFEKQLKPFKAINEQKEKVTTAAFTSDDAAFQAKAAMMAMEKDDFMQYAKKKNVQLSPKAQRFFTLAAYNGGAGAAQAMLDDYQAQGLLKDDAFLKNKPKARFGRVYNNVMPRLAGADMFNGEQFFKNLAPKEDQQAQAQAPAPKTPQAGDSSAKKSGLLAAKTGKK